MDSKALFFVIAALSLLFAANIVFLDIAVFGVRKPQETASPVSQTAAPVCSGTCLAVTPPPSRAPSPTPGNGTQTVTVPDTGAPKEYYIPLGTGSTKSDAWQTVSGMEATIDTSLYQHIRSVTFESSLSIPAGVGWMRVKLYNATDGHDVWGSELTSESDTARAMQSSISLDAGNKRYIVQALSTIRAEALIANARIKIVAD